MYDTEWYKADVHEEIYQALRMLNEVKYTSFAHPLNQKKTRCLMFVQSSSSVLAVAI
jgi:hypothetical protein